MAMSVLELLNNIIYMSMGPLNFHHMHLKCTLILHFWLIVLQSNTDFDISKITNIPISSKKTEFHKVFKLQLDFLETAPCTDTIL